MRRNPKRRPNRYLDDHIIEIIKSKNGSARWTDIKNGLCDMECNAPDVSVVDSLKRLKFYGFIRKGEGRFGKYSIVKY